MIRVEHNGNVEFFDKTITCWDVVNGILYLYQSENPLAIIAFKHWSSVRSV